VSGPTRRLDARPVHILADRRKSARENAAALKEAVVTTALKWHAEAGPFRPHPAGEAFDRAVDALNAFEQGGGKK
jgi:hypothetical protein